MALEPDGTAAFDIFLRSHPLSAMLGRLRPFCPQLPYEGLSIAVRQSNVANQQIKLLLRGLLQSSFNALSSRHVIAARLEEELHLPYRIKVVVNQ